MWWLYYGDVSVLSRAVKVVPAKTVTIEQRPEGSKGMSYVTVKMSWAERTAGARCPEACMRLASSGTHVEANTVRGEGARGSSRRKNQEVAGAGPWGSWSP